MTGPSASRATNPLRSLELALARNNAREPFMEAFATTKQLPPALFAPLQPLLGKLDDEFGALHRRNGDPWNSHSIEVAAQYAIDNATRITPELLPIDEPTMALLIAHDGAEDKTDFALKNGEIATADRPAFRRKQVRVWTESVIDAFDEDLSAIARYLGTPGHALIEDVLDAVTHGRRSGGGKEEYWALLAYLFKQKPQCVYIANTIKKYDRAHNAGTQVPRSLEDTFGAAPLRARVATLESRAATEPGAVSQDITTLREELRDRQHTARTRHEANIDTTRWILELSKGMALNLYNQEWLGPRYENIARHTTPEWERWLFIRGLTAWDRMLESMSASAQHLCDVLVVDGGIYRNKDAARVFGRRNTLNQKVARHQASKHGRSFQKSGVMARLMQYEAHRRPHAYQSDKNTQLYDTLTLRSYADDARNRLNAFSGEFYAFLAGIRSEAPEFKQLRQMDEKFSPFIRAYMKG